MKRESIAPRLDVKAFAESASAISGLDLLSKYERLMLETHGMGADRSLAWSARGEVRLDEALAPQVWLHLTLAANLPLTCQRCLGPVDIAVAVQRSFRFCDTEAMAAAQDEEAQEDVLALSQDFSLAELIEDEVLLALPLVACHAACPVEVKLTVADPGFAAALTEKSNPFAVLAKLQGGKSN